MSQTTHGATSSAVTDDGDQYDCPLCDHAEASERDVYSHLMVTHRKSTLSDALLDARDE